MSESVTLRPADIADAALLLSWRNDPLTREASHNSSPVNAAEHGRWLQSQLDDPNCVLMIAECQHNPVGTARADRRDDGWELSWTVAPAARGKGLAKQMVALLANRISEPVRAEIKQGNTASIRVAEYAGMEFAHETDNILHYRRAARPPQ
jgi:RimJ/RimL family protein N-acetyltransferase